MNKSQSARAARIRKEPFKGNPSIHGPVTWNEDVIIADYPEPYVRDAATREIIEVIPSSSRSG